MHFVTFRDGSIRHLVQRRARAHCRNSPICPVNRRFGDNALTLTNNYRARRGLTALLPNDTLRAIAREHSRYQARRNKLSHDGFRQRMTKAKDAGLSSRCAENAGYNYRSAQHLLSGWKQSSGLLPVSWTPR